MVRPGKADENGFLPAPARSSTDTRKAPEGSPGLNISRGVGGVSLPPTPEILRNMNNERISAWKKLMPKRQRGLRKHQIVRICNHSRTGKTADIQRDPTRSIERPGPGWR